MKWYLKSNDYMHFMKSISPFISKIFEFEKNSPDKKSLKNRYGVNSLYWLDYLFVNKENSKVLELNCGGAMRI